MYINNFLVLSSIKRMAALAMFWLSRLYWFYSGELCNIKLNLQGAEIQRQYCLGLKKSVIEKKSAM